jgi:ABC-type arginine transport system ATPase subunit
VLSESDKQVLAGRKMGDTLLAVLNLLSIALTGALGVANLLVDFKNEQGEVTVWGRRALIAVLASSKRA